MKRAPARVALVALIALGATRAAAQDAGVAEPDAPPTQTVDEPEQKPKPKKKAKKKAKKDKVGTKTEDTVEGGTHWRINSEKGPIHVWIPPGYDRDTAGIVVYIHGYHTDVDGAWKDHDLAAQFKASKQNAMFILPEAPAAREDPVYWPALADLRKAVRKARIRLPAGPTVVIGHSAAYRTISQWVDNKRLEQVILLDALYGREASFDDFIGTGKRAEQHKLILIGSDTADEGKAFAKKYPFAVTRDTMPEKLSDFTKDEKKAKLLYIKSQYSHMEIVTGGKVIPLLLRLTPLVAL